MIHSIDFFRDEIRTGFYIPTQVKVAWAAALDVLAEIDRICTGHGIKYFADWGTILGAVRHGGFVPWDDDLDICMLRDDYIKFRAVADNELPSEYCIHDYERQQDHWLFLSRVVNRRHISFDEKVLCEGYNLPWLTGVDIFVKDYLYPDPADEKKRDEEVLRLIAVADGITDSSLNASTIDIELDSIKKKYQTSLPSPQNKRAVSVALYALAEQQMARVNRDEAKEIGQIFPFILKGGKGEPKELYETLVRISFEDTTIPVPAQYNKVLTSRYGNYNELRKVWSGHTYPAFEAQKELFESSAGVRLPRFEYAPHAAKRPSVDRSGSLKSMAKECLEGLKTLYRNLFQLSFESSQELFVEKLGELQQLAVDLGTLIENVKGENNPHSRAIVTVLEHFCEEIFNCSQTFNSDQSGSDSTSSDHTASEGSSSLTSLGSYLDTLEITLTEHLFSRKEILFLPIGHREWETMSKVYESALQKKDADPVVVPLPLFTKDYFGNSTMSMDDIRASAGIDRYPNDLPIQNWESYDPALHCPDTIYIQFPYDGENIYLTIPQKYFAQNLRTYTENLIYIPIGKTSEFGPDDVTDQSNLKYYVTAPAVVYSDKVFVQSDNIRLQYVNALTDFAGKETKDVWESKIQADASLFEDRLRLTDSPKKNLLYCISLYEFAEHADHFEDVIKERLDILSSAGNKLEVSLCFYPEDYSCSDPQLQTEIDSLREFITGSAKERGIETIPLPTDDLYSFVSSFDAYYGSSCPLVHVFTGQHKPVMIADYTIYI